MARSQYTPNCALAQLPAPPGFVDRLRHAQAGCSVCLDLLMAQHETLVQWTLRQGGWGPFDYETALQAARIGLWKALLHFDPTRGFAFSSYAVVAMRRQVCREETCERRFWRSRPSLGPDLPPDPLEDALDHLAQGAVAPWVDQLRPRLRFILRSYYGLDGRPPRDLPTLARQLGCRKQRTHQLLHEALHVLALPAFSWTVRLLLGRTDEAELRAAQQAWWRARRQGRWLRWRPYR